MSLMLSCCLITYNHKNYIRKAIDSILMQKVDFEREIIIADDCSKDGTTQIIEEYVAKYPTLIKHIKREKNVGAAQNYVELLMAATGKYVAYLDGDDYWTSENKVQEQVNFLESNEDCVISAHDSEIEDINGNLQPSFKSRTFKHLPLNNKFKLEDFLLNDFFNSASIVYRRNALPPFPKWYMACKAGDFFLVLILTMQGDIHYINKCYSVYRFNPNSISTHYTRFEILESFEEGLRQFNKYSNSKYAKQIEKRNFGMRFSLMYYYPNYFKKISFSITNFHKILAMDSRFVNLMGKLKIFLPTILLKHKVDINAKKEKD
jgi:glycosyltransferase involved in cell wall biosynthesis